MKVNDEKKNAVIGARIMQRRKLLGMKQSELAELIESLIIRYPI